jgi:hypothetical protein
MFIHDFYSKFISTQEEGTLFKALRRLSLIEDVKSLSGEDADDAAGAWAMWSGADGPSQQPVLRRA